MAGKKSFFKRRTVSEISKMNICEVENPNGLVELIDSIDNKKDAIILNFPLVHPDFDEFVSEERKNRQYISRTTMRGIRRKGREKRYPSYLKLNQPISREQAFSDTRCPYQIRNQAFISMKGFCEEENFIVGYMRFPVIGGERNTPILTPFWAIMRGAKIDGYNGRICAKLPKEFNAGARVLHVYGPNVYVFVPSTTKGKKRYLQMWRNVSTESDDSRKKVTCWGTRPSYGFISEGEFKEDLSKGPEHKNFNIGNEGKNMDGASYNFFPIEPHDVAGHQTILRHFYQMNNFSPWEMSQFSIPSREDALFWNKLENNLLIKEINPQRNYVLKHLRIDQLSILMARRVAKYIGCSGKGESEKTMFWDLERDGRISDYPWLPGEI